MSANRVAVVLVAALALVLPVILSDQFLLHILIMVLLYAVLATSLNLIVGYIGELSLGHAAFLGLGAYCSTILTVDFGAPVLPAMLCAGLAAAVGGLVIGYITLRLEGHYFVLITLAFAEVLRLIALNWHEVTRGPLGFPNIPAPKLAVGGLMFDFSTKAQFYYLALVILVFTLWITYQFVNSNMGRAAIAIRENRRLAQSVGINPFHYAMAAFVIGAFFAGLSGAFYAHYITYVGPEVFGFSFTVTMLIMIVVGGRGTIVGPVLGAAIIAILLEELRFAQEIRLSIFGILLVLCVLFFPDGLVRLPDILRRRRLGRSQPKSAVAPDRVS